MKIYQLQRGKGAIDVTNDPSLLQVAVTLTALQLEQVFYSLQFRKDALTKRMEAFPQHEYPEDKAEIELIEQTFKALRGGAQ